MFGFLEPRTAIMLLIMGTCFVVDRTIGLEQSVSYLDGAKVFEAARDRIEQVGLDVRAVMDSVIDLEKAYMDRIASGVVDYVGMVRDYTIAVKRMILAGTEFFVHCTPKWDKGEETVLQMMQSIDRSTHGEEAFRKILLNMYTMSDSCKEVSLDHLVETTGHMVFMGLRIYEFCPLVTMRKGQIEMLQNQAEGKTNMRERFKNNIDALEQVALGLTECKMVLGEDVTCYDQKELKKLTANGFSFEYDGASHDGWPVFVSVAAASVCERMPYNCDNGGKCGVHWPLAYVTPGHLMELAALKCAGGECLKGCRITLKEYAQDGECYVEDLDIGVGRVVKSRLGVEVGPACYIRGSERFERNGAACDNDPGYGKYNFMGTESEEIGVPFQTMWIEGEIMI